MIRFSAPQAAVLGLVVLCLPAVVLAQGSKSAAVGKDLAAAMDAKKLDSIAAKDPSDPGRYIAALYFPGTQLLVISGKYSVPQLLDPKVMMKQYRDVYMELNGTVPKDSKIFVQDMGAPGLADKKANGAFDTWTEGDKQIAFDGNWDGQKISESDYGKRFAAADEAYAKILSVLLAEAKK